MTLKLELKKMKTKTFFVLFFKCSLNFRAHALQSELNKVSISNLVKFFLHSRSFKIEQAFEKGQNVQSKLG